MGIGLGAGYPLNNRREGVSIPVVDSQQREVVSVADSDIRFDILFGINYGREDILACLPDNKLAEIAALVDLSVAKLAAAGDKPFEPSPPVGADDVQTRLLLERTYQIYTALKQFAASEELAQLRDEEDLQAALQLQGELLAFKQAMLAHKRAAALLED